MCFQKTFHQIIPGVFQRFIHGKYTARDAGSAGQLLVLVQKVQVHAGNILRREGRVDRRQSARKIFTGKLKDEFEGNRGALAFD